MSAVLDRILAKAGLPAPVRPLVAPATIVLDRTGRAIVPPPAVAAPAAAPEVEPAQSWPEYFAGRGWTPIPVAPRGKKPLGEAWQETRGYDPAAFPAGCNVGILLGEASGDLIDVDHDCAESIELASRFLPETCTFGRRSAPRSHWLYKCAIDSATFEDPVRDAENKAADKAAAKAKTEAKAAGKTVEVKAAIKPKTTIVEIRSSRRQTVAPGSFHKDTGEAIEFTDVAEVEPLAIDPADLRIRVARLAAASLLRRYWPSAGGRHDTQLALIGALLSDGWTEADVHPFVCAIWDRDGGREAAASIRSTASKIVSGEPVSTWGTLAKSINRKAADAVRRWIGAADGRPLITITTQLHREVDQAIAALATDPNVFQRAGELVAIVRVTDAESKRALLAEGTPTIRRIAPPTLRKILSKVVRWEKYEAKGDTPKACLPSDPILQAVFSNGEFPKVEHIEGITETPLLRADGTVVSTPGYDTATGFLYAPTCDFPPVPDQPTQADARAALAILLEPFRDFPYAEEAQRMVPVCALLSVIARPAIGSGNVPAFVFDSNKPRTGKGLQTQIVSLVTTGRIVASTQWPGDGEEAEKILGALALQGAGLICFDNIETTQAVGGAPLCLTLTCHGQRNMRVLGQSSMPSLPWRGVILLNGNNLRLRKDIRGRVLFSRLLTKLEHPERRPVAEYRHPELLKWVRETRPGFVGAALTVLRAWYVAGKPSCGCERLETFEEWSALVPPAIVHAGGLDPLACRLLVGGDADDHESQAEYALVALLQNFGDAGTSVAHLVDVLFRGMSGQPAIWHADLREALIALAPPRPGCREPSSEQVAGVLRRLKDQVLDGLVLEAKPGVHSAVRWCVRTVGGYEVVEVVSAAGPENGSGGSGGSGASTAKISAKGGSNLRNLVTSPRLTGRFAAINAVTPPRGDP